MENQGWSSSKQGLQMPMLRKVVQLQKAYSTSNTAQEQKMRVQYYA